MKRICVFCGEEVTNKSKEHIIPQWLIRLTGDPNRDVYLGINYPKSDKWSENPDSFLRKFSFKAFQFPACSSCNSEHSELENETKIVIEKLLSKSEIGIGEMDTLLDWYDKVRIGLWLGYYYLNKNMANINPKFAIKKRIGKKDRMLAIYHYKDISNGINFIGTDTPAFQHLPASFGLRINGYFFFNISTEYFFSKNLGFPYMTNLVFLDDGASRISGDLVKGSGKAKYRVLNKNIMDTSAQFIQPIFDNFLAVKPDKDIYENNDYVKRNTLSAHAKKGAIFIPEKKGGYKGISVPDFMISNNIDDLSISLPLSVMNYRFAKMIWDYQVYMFSHSASTDLLDKQSQREFKEIISNAKKYNQLMIDIMKQQTVQDFKNGN